MATTNAAVLTDARGNALRATRHAAAGVTVISLWHGRQCAATVRLDHDDAARLAAFLGNTAKP